MRKRLIPTGISDFKVLIKAKYAYIDKSLFIQELIERGINKVSLILRPRRFGKTLNLSMLHYFFEKSEEDNKPLFTHLNIWENEECVALQGQFPVIFLSLKNIKYTTWEEAFQAFRHCIASEFQRHSYLLEGDTLSPVEKEEYDTVLRAIGHSTLYAQTLLSLSKWLHRYHKKEVVLLIDEYDSPAHSAYVNGYYESCISFLRNWLSAGLKDNSSVGYGVVTGILHITKESIFSGLNNITTFSILDKTFQDKFGFLEFEVQTLLKECDLQDKLDEMRAWYDGYRIGTVDRIYNPWSVLTCVEEQGTLAPYWVNTSDNALMIQLITQGSDAIKKDIEEIMRGGSIEKNIESGIVFTELQQNSDAIWSLLLFCGYLAISETRVYGIPSRLKIPNAEVKELYKTMILNWFKQSINAENYQLLLTSLITGDINTFSRILQEFLLTSFSFFDVSAQHPERVYHAFVLGMLTGLKGKYEVKSNRESGYGRYDVTLFPKNLNDLGIVMEFKKINALDNTDLESAAQEALKQIEDKKYTTELLDRGVKRILSIGLAFEGKKVLVRAKHA